LVAVVKHTEETRAKIRAVMNTPRMKRIMHDAISRGWTPERRAKQAAVLAARRAEPGFEEKRLASMRSTMKDAGSNWGERRLAWMRSTSKHPNPTLPPMTKKENGRYRYLRSIIGREAALAEIARARNPETPARQAA
jgi:hypothetical protein